MSTHDLTPSEPEPEPEVDPVSLSLSDDDVSTDGSFECGDRSDEDELNEDDKAFIVDDNDDAIDTGVDDDAGAGDHAPNELADDTVLLGEVCVVDDDDDDDDDEIPVRLAYALQKLESLTQTYLYKIAKDIMEIQPFDWVLTGERTKTGKPKKKQEQWDQERLLEVITEALMDPDVENHEILMNHMTIGFRPDNEAPDPIFRESCGGELTMAAIITTTHGGRPRRKAAKRALTSIKTHVTAPTQEWEMPVGQSTAEDSCEEESKGHDDDEDDDEEDGPVSKRTRASYSSSASTSSGQDSEEDFAPSESEDYSEEDEDDSDFE